MADGGGGGAYVLNASMLASFGVVRVGVNGVKVGRVRSVVEPPDPADSTLDRVLGLKAAARLWRGEGLTGWTRGFLLHSLGLGMASVGGNVGVEAAVALLGDRGYSEGATLVLASQLLHTTSVLTALPVELVTVRSMLSRHAGALGGFFDDYPSLIVDAYGGADARVLLYALGMTVGLNAAAIGFSEMRYGLAAVSPTLAAVFYAVAPVLATAPMHSLYYRMLSGSYRSQSFFDVVRGMAREGVVGSFYAGFGIELLVATLGSAIMQLLVMRA